MTTSKYQKRKSTGPGINGGKVSRRAVTLSQLGDSDFVLSQEPPTHSLYAGGGIKRFLERTKGQRLITVEEHFPDLKQFSRSA